MKLVTFVARGSRPPVPRAGILYGDDLVIDVDLASQAGGHSPLAGGAPDGGSASSLLTLIRNGERALEAARERCNATVERGYERQHHAAIRHQLCDVQLLAPLPRPNSLRDYLVVREHVERSFGSVPEEWYRIPAHYKGNVDEIYGPDDTVPWPAYTDKLDYELEICAVIGRPGRRVTAERAAKYIVGYTLYNDWSARDIQWREMSIGIGPSISKDFASSIGPCIATPDEFDRDTAHLEARIDGEVWSSGTLGTMHFSFEEIIEWTTQEQTLHPGDLLGSGTVGKGCGLELDRWITQGSVVELEATGIGVLRNRVGHKGEGPNRVVALTQCGAPA
jgi:2-keto-4-pentenoate hydratase/2-oxohepta-3-ene-1,7-dioic acid hydratase in catechol pathway